MNSNIRLKVVIVSAVGLLCILLVGWQEWKHYKKAETIALTEYNNRQLIMAQSSARGITASFNAIIQSLQGLTERIDFLNMPEGPIRRELDSRYIKNLMDRGLMDVSVVDKKGIMRYNRVSHFEEGKDFSQQDYFINSKKAYGKSLFIAQLVNIKGFDPGYQSLLICMPVFHFPSNRKVNPHPQFVGAIVGILKINIFADNFIAPLTTGIKTGVNGAILLDHKSQVIWANNPELTGKIITEQKAAYPGFTSLFHNMVKNKEGSGEFHFISSASPGSGAKSIKEERLLAYTNLTLMGKPWYLGVWAPKSEIQKNLKDIFNESLIIVGIAFVIIGAAMGYFFLIFFRHNRFLKSEVARKDRELDLIDRQTELTRQLHLKEIERASQLATVGELAASVAHEIRNPIAGIKNTLEVIIDESLLAREKDIILEIINQLNRVNKTIQDLINFSRPNKPNFEAINVHSVLKQVVDFYKMQFHDNGVELEENYQAEKCMIEGDQELLKQVFVNIITNSYQAYDGSPGEIELSTRVDSEKDHILISIKDNGPGIPEKVLPKLYKPFFTTKAKGSGLGLSLSRSNILLHEGELSAINNPDRGATFTIELPLFKGNNGGK